MGYSDEEKRARIQKARKFLEEQRAAAEAVDAARDATAAVPEDAPAIPWRPKNLNAYGLPIPSGAGLEQWRAEAEELNRRREEAIAERKEQERQDREQRARSSTDWNEWV